MCIDYRAVNAVTTIDAFPIPSIKTILHRMRGAQFYSTFDLKDAYHQVRIADKDKYKTAFITAYGLYQWKVMPFGLVNAPAIFQRLMAMVVKDIGTHRSSVYLDDLIIFSVDEQEHLDAIRSTMAILRSYHLYVNIVKCRFGRKSIAYLGFIVDLDKIRVDPDRLKKVESMAAPKSKL